MKTQRSCALGLVGPTRPGPQCLDSFLKSRLVAEIDEFGVAQVGVGDAAGVFDGAPMGLGPGGDLADPADQAIGIAAIDAIQFLKGVEIGQVLAVYDDIVAAMHLGDAVDGKAGGLV